MTEIKLGDRITFRPVCRWHGKAKVTRKVIGVHLGTSYPIVRFGGWPDFVVRPQEVVSIQHDNAKRA